MRDDLHQELTDLRAWLDTEHGQDWTAFARRLTDALHRATAPYGYSDAEPETPAPAPPAPATPPPATPPA